MASTPDNISMALFCDFENVALGVRDANYDKFDIKRVLERLLLKGSIVVKKAYCDWDRYKGFKSPMHEANFELIEIPHVRQSGKNSADIRLVVDALDLCYTKSHVNTFVIISGDSDFSPLVSKLRENAKYVIGVGVKQSTSDLLIANCDEFIFYDDLVRESQRNSARRDNRDTPQPRRTPEEEARRKAEMDTRRTKAIEMAVETYEALVTDRDVGGKIWASVLKEAIKRRNPGFNENYYGFRTFGNLLEEAQNRGLLEFGRDEKSSAFVSRGNGVTRGETSSASSAPNAAAQAPAQLSETLSTKPELPLGAGETPQEAKDASEVDQQHDQDAHAAHDEGSAAAPAAKSRSRARRPRQASAKSAAKTESTSEAPATSEERPVKAPAPVVASTADEAPPADAAPGPAKKTRGRTSGRTNSRSRTKSTAQADQNNKS
ncbi:NYN domain-containing protein [Aquabacterium sp.]|uniref:NYN domain-containing protein n=1 Tax=Aquabacterium sp. TaxID=1872578 RepID=UPI002E37287D|nr:NYN domain-containing protein [Aquabacterium sp.]HEX5312942.1 NYN domain-containing protein [Aquabacterium sp.]